MFLVPVTNPDQRRIPRLPLPARGHAAFETMASDILKKFRRINTTTLKRTLVIDHRSIGVQVAKVTTAGNMKTARADGVEKVYIIIKNYCPVLVRQAQ